jgi:hypothetical protein
VDTPQSGPSRGCLYGFWIGVAVVLGVVGCGLHAARESWQAELNLHSTLYVIRLVDHFVQEHGRWPDSWAELEAMPFGSEGPKTGAPGSNIVRIGGAMDFDWPRQSSELRDRVAIDFTVDEPDVVAQDVVEFKAIHPIGPYYNYWKYGFIEELQDSLRIALEGE